MKIAISTQDDNMDSIIDQRFGRCKYFMIVDLENNELTNSEPVLNKGPEQGHGAGIRAAEQLAELKVEAVITGELGPNATGVLDRFEIKTYHASGSAKDAVSNFIEAKLKSISVVAEPHNGTAQEESKEEPSNDKEEKIFFPLMDNKGLDSTISQHFGHAPFFGLYNTGTKEFKIIPNDLTHTDPNKSPIDQIEEAVNPTTIFAKGIGGRAIQIIQQKGLGLKTGDFNTVKEVIDNLDKLEDQMQSCGHEH